MVNMKKITFFLLFVFAIPFVPRIVFSAEAIPSFDARIVVQENATIEVTERIVYDFGNRERHGIFRNIPYSYQAGTETYIADVRSVLVTDEFGEPRPFQEARGNGELELKIGDPEVTVTGIQTYVLSYIVEGPFLYFDEHDEFYWNVTGYWSQPIGVASVLVDLPRGAEVITASCYKGEDGSRASCDSDEKLVNVERAGYTATANNLGPNEGLTVAVAFPKGSIAVRENPWMKKEPLSSFIFIPLVLPVLTILGMGYLWYRRGRDPKGKSTIVTEFSPPRGIEPALAGVLESEWVRSKEITAGIIALATEGFLTIHRVEKKILLFTIPEYVFERKGDAIPTDPIQALMLEQLFQKEFEGDVEVEGRKVRGTLLSKMKNNFVKEKKMITEFIYREATEQGFFIARPDTVRTWYVVAGVVFFVVGVGVAVLFGDNHLWVVSGIAIAISGIPVALFGNFMPAKTKEGVRMREHLLGFKRYLTIAEKDRIAFHDSPHQNVPEKTVTLFSAYLPYAMVFGVEEEWTKQFEDILREQPSWYDGGAHGAFSASALASGLSDLSSDVGSAMAPRSSGAGGGGSVGGGFGGGGGGSW